MASNFWVLWQPPIGIVTPYFGGLVPYDTSSDDESDRPSDSDPQSLREDNSRSSDDDRNSDKNHDSDNDRNSDDDHNSQLDRNLLYSNSDESSNE